MDCQLTVNRKQLKCPNCFKPHIDVGKWAYKLHHKHLCHYCGHIWRLDDYVFGIDINKPSIGFPATEYAEGFNRGCQYSNTQIQALEKELKTLHTQLAEEKHSLISFRVGKWHIY